MNTIVAGIAGVLATTCAASIGHAYTKPNTYRHDDGVPAFRAEVPYSPHSWILAKAIEFLRTSGYTADADLARAYLLPMLEGVTYNDVWGDADLAGASVLDYYSPGASNTGYGFGCVLDNAFFAPYKNCTNSYQIRQPNGSIVTVLGFDKHPLYGYGNAASHAQFRYDYAKRIYSGHWGDDPRDKMAGWVIDTIFGQDDPFDGRWASGSANIDNATAPNGQQSRFGSGYTPSRAMNALNDNHTVTEYFCHDHSDPLFSCPDEDSPRSSLRVPNNDLLGDAPEWLDDHFNNADDIEAYEGWDGHKVAIYGSWTEDAGGKCHDGADCSAPMMLRFPVGSKEHAFFQLGWAIHLLEDNTTPVHTVHKSFITYEVHNLVEGVADSVLIDPVRAPIPGAVAYVKDALPAANAQIFQALYAYPPRGIDIMPDANCTAPPNPAAYFKPSWWADSLVYTDPQAGGDQDNGGVAHAYTRSLAEIANRYMPYISDCHYPLPGQTTPDDFFTYSSMGFFTALGLDNAIKATAGLIRQFIEDIDKTPPVVTVSQPVKKQYLHSDTLDVSYVEPIDAESGIKSVMATVDGRSTVGNTALANGAHIKLLTDLPLGDHTFALAASDNAGNRGAATVAFSVIATPPSLKLDVGQFFSNGSIASRDVALAMARQLDLAAAAYARGNCAAARTQYLTFTRALATMSGQGISAAAARILAGDIRYVSGKCGSSSG
jgi:hypothetical protein